MQGWTSHAAIVGLSLGIPVIVGVENAVPLLENEMDITVDSGSGHIYSGEKMYYDRTHGVGVR